MERESEADRLNAISLSLIRGEAGPPRPEDAEAYRNISRAMGYAKGGRVATYGECTPTWSLKNKPTPR